MSSVSLPRISVITPSYNQVNYIEQTIQSVLGQNYPNLEYFIIDGGSTDGSVEIIKKYEKQLAWWVSEKDSGQANAINKGFSKCTGDIICWLNSDDLYMPNTFHTISKFFTERSEKKIVLGNCISFYEHNPSRVLGTNMKKFAEHYALNLFDYIFQPSTFWSRAALESTGPLNETVHYVFDWEWYLRMQKGNVNFVYTDTVFSLYRFHDSHKSGTGGNKRRDEILEFYRKFNSPQEVKALEQHFWLQDKKDSPWFRFLLKTDRLKYRLFFKSLVTKKQFDSIKRVQ
jgi:glycosyltransferase involved in cell wall biosynthesis